MKLKKNKIVLIAVVILFILSLVPIFWISIYNHPSADDFNFSYDTNRVFRQTGSIFKTIEMGINKTISKYFDWQGTFAAIFVMTLQPSVWGDAYYISTFVLMGVFIFAHLFFGKKLFYDLLKLNRTNYLILIMIIMTICIQLVPKPVSAFFWYNGSVYYTLTYSVALVLYGLIINIILSEKKSTVTTSVILASLLAIFIGGSNFVTSLISMIVIIMTIAYLIFKKNDKFKLVFIALVFLVLSFLIATLAPGNAERQAYYQGMSPVKAIIMSLYYGLIYITRIDWGWIVAPWSVIVLSLIMIPFIGGVIKNTKYSFKYPLIVLFISFCIFSAQFTPTLYSTAGSGPMRLKNIIFYSFIWLLLLNYTYMLGWLYKKARDFYGDSKRFDEAMRKVYNKCLIPFIACAFIFGGILLVDDVVKTTSVSASLSLITGEAKQYDAQMDARRVILLGTDKDVVVDPLSVEPYVLFLDDITNPPCWLNQSVELFYEKDSVTLR